MSVLHVHSTDLEQLCDELDARVAQAPGFFAGMPVLLDLDKLGSDAGASLQDIVSCVRARGLQLLGVRSDDEAVTRLARSRGLAVLSTDVLSGTGHADKPYLKQSKPASALVIDQPVRSGQQVYAQNRDLILLGAVSAGAEVIADGNIHVYGRLRGRALAGARGDTSARIFCHGLEAELVAVAGNYLVSEQLEASRGKSVQILLTGDELLIKEL